MSRLRSGTRFLNLIFVANSTNLLLLVITGWPAAQDQSQELPGCYVCRPQCKNYDQGADPWYVFRSKMMTPHVNNYSPSIFCELPLTPRIRQLYFSLEEFRVAIMVPLSMIGTHLPHSHVPSMPTAPGSSCIKRKSIDMPPSYGDFVVPSFSIDMDDLYFCQFHHELDCKWGSLFFRCKVCFHLFIDTLSPP